MAIPFALPLQSQITDENKLAASENVPDSLGDIALAGDNIEFKPETEPNYSVVGIPTIEDNIVSGFNSSSCLTTENPFIAEECTGIEIVLVFEVPAVAGVPLIANAIPGVAPYFRVLIGSSGSLAIKYTDTIGEDKTASARAFITADTKNWYKAIYDASAGTWTHYNSTDEGVTWTLLNRVSDYSNAPSLETGNLLYWGKNGENQGVTYFNGKIYLEDCYIKTTSASGEKTLKFFKETGKTTVSATIPQPDLTGYLQNLATGTDALTLLGTAANSTKALNIGVGSQATNVCTTVVGNAARASSGGATAVGCNARATAYCATAIGGSNAADASYASSTDAIALGHYARATADSAIQIGYGENNTAHTLAIGLSHNDTYTLLKSDGTIPGERMSLQGTTAPDTTTVGSIGQFYVDTTTTTGYMCVAADTTTPSYTWKQITYSPVGTEYILETGNWNAENNSIEISIPGLTIGTPMWIAPTVSEDNSNELNYTTHGIKLKAQQADSIILSCTVIPTENISITIIR